MKKWFLVLIGIPCSLSLLQAQSEDTSNPMQSLMPCQVSFLVTNLDETVKWYRQKLGFQLIESWQDDYSQQRTVTLELNGFGIEILESLADAHSADSSVSSMDESGKGSLSPYRRIAFRVNDIDAVMQELKARGVELLTGSGLDTYNEVKFCVIKDNNGNPIKLIQNGNTRVAGQHGTP